MNDTLIFLHLPRTGGTTLRDILSKQYSDKVTFENKTLLDTDQNFSVENKSEKGKHKLIKGHVYFGIHEHIIQNCTYFSMMRNPIERVTSVYNYIKIRPKHKDYEYIKNKSITHYIESKRNLFMDNGQTRLLAGRHTSLEVPFRRINEGHLEQAKENIKNHFILVGLTERYDETLLLLQRMLQWKTPTYSIANAAKREKKTKQHAPKIRELIAEYNQLDLQLYHYVSVLFDKQISNNPKVLEKLEKFELKNRFAGKFHVGSRIKRKISKWTKH